MHISIISFLKEVKKEGEGIQRNPIFYVYKPNIFFSNVCTNRTFFLMGVSLVKFSWGSNLASFIKHNHIHTACADYIV